MNLGDEPLSVFRLRYGSGTRSETLYSAFFQKRFTKSLQECLNDTYLGMWNAIPPQKRNGSELTCALDELSESVPHAPSSEEEYMLSQVARLLNDYIRHLSDPGGGCLLFVSCAAADAHSCFKADAGFFPMRPFPDARPVPARSRSPRRSPSAFCFRKSED